jgi:hypothetical protein
MIANAEPSRFLAIYLNDHLAGATGGVELARRLRSSAGSDPRAGEPLAEVCAEIEADRDTLRQLMQRLEIHRGSLKPAVAWAGEKAGRLKLNGRLTRSSPLSRLVELELLFVGITGKGQLWRSLERALGESLDEFDFRQLAARADHQREVVGELQLEAATALTPRRAR